MVAEFKMKELIDLKRWKIDKNELSLVSLITREKNWNRIGVEEIVEIIIEVT